MKKRAVAQCKGFLVLALAIFFLFGNTVAVKGNTILLDKRQTTDTFTSLGGEYSIQNILGSYGVFSFRDITGSHIVGPIVAKEKVYKTESDGISLEPINDFIAVADLSNGISSYVGEVTKRNGVGKPTFEMNHTYSYDMPTPNLYTRYSDMNIWQDTNSYKLYKNNKEESFFNPNNGKDGTGNGEIFQNDNFINFQEAKNQIKKESLEILTRQGRVVAPDPNTGYLKIEAGHNYIINDASKLRIVDLIFPEGYDGVTNYYPYPTFINFSGSNLALSGTAFESVEILPGTITQPVTLPKIGNEDYQFFPDIYVNGVSFDGTIAGPSGSADFGEKLNILWNLPNVKTLDGGYKMAKTGYGDILGHIIAPDVQFYNYIIDKDGNTKWGGGNMNGGAIVDSWYGGRREVHYWPYKDDIENPVFKDFSIKGNKSLIGKPLENNEFKFKLDLIYASDPEGIVNIEFPEISNSGSGTLYFPIIEFEKAGIYEFSIKEVIDTSIDKVTFDKSEYKLIVNVKEDPLLSLLNINYEIYKVKDEDGFALDPMVKVEEIEFNNIYDYTLPATGGIGNRGYLILGFIIMISSLLILAWKNF
ncbi:MAG: Spy0128 family protein [Clostridium sp.]